MSEADIPIQIAQQPVDNEISAALFGVLPEDWGGIRIEARRTVVGAGAESYRIDLISTENKPGLAFVSDELQDAVRKLFLLHKRHNTNLCLARYILQQGLDGWNLVSEFEYDDAN